VGFHGVELVMQRTFIAAAGIGAALAVPATAHAQIIEIGQASQQATPSCPAVNTCYAITRTTGYQTRAGSAKAGLMTVHDDGRIVAWTISLGTPTAKQITFFDDKAGGEATAQLTILQPGKTWHQRVVAQGERQLLSPYFGSTVQFPLQRSIPVKKGQIVALTVPTWAPAFMISPGANTTWRASRVKGRCGDADALRQTAQTKLSTIAQYACEYTTRLTYSATLIPTPKPTIPPKKA
jgi:hypothetical protein